MPRIITFLRPINLILLLLVVVIGIYKFILVNENVQSIHKDCLSFVSGLDNKFFSVEDPSSMKATFNESLFYFKESIADLERIERALMNSNTLTFLVTLIIVFLAGILFNIEERARIQVERSEKSLHSLKIDREITKLHSDLQELKILVLSTQALSHTDSSNSNNIIQNEIFKKAKKITQDFDEDHYSFITKDVKEDLREIIQNVIYPLKSNMQLIDENNQLEKMIYDTIINILEDINKSINKLKIIDYK